MSANAAFLKTLEQEHARTRMLLHLFPADKAEFRPHERSSSAFMLAWTFVVEEQLMLKAVKHELQLGAGFPKPPDSWTKVLASFDEVHGQLVGALSEGGELTGTVKFPVAPKQIADWAVADFLWFMLHDQIHHRGQLSVYTRMAGGKVPSIYGPSADEPWN